MNFALLVIRDLFIIFSRFIMKNFYTNLKALTLGEKQHSFTGFKPPSNLPPKTQRQCLNALLLVTLFLFGASDIIAQCTPTFETVSQATGATTIDINTPTGTVQDDLLVAMVANNDGQPGSVTITNNGNSNYSVDFSGTLTNNEQVSFKATHTFQ